MRRLPLFGLLGLAACQASIGDPLVSGSTPGPGPDPTRPTDPGTPPPPPPPPPPPVDHCAGVGISPGPAPMRRLSNEEYRYTLEDLVGDATLARQVTAGFPAETESLGFRNAAQFLEVPVVVAERYQAAAERVAEAHTRTLLPCDPAQAGEDACADRLIREVGARLYRRPLEAAEVARYQTLYQDTKRDYDFATATEWVVFTLLQSPHFLYRVELSAPLTAGEVVFVPPYEMASRLSYLLWHSMPDQVLFDAAAAGQLASKGEIEAQARRMLQDPRARRAFDFYREWFDVDEAVSMQRDTGVFPGLSAELPALLEGETRAFVDHVLWEEDGTLETLFTAPYSFANQALAAHYGWAGGPSGASFTRVDRPSGHSGVLTQAGVLAVHDRPTRTSIVRRGLKIRTDFLCQTIGAPPDNVNLELPPIMPGQSQKDRLELHRTNPTCAACHNMMDPIGVVFERFDAVGRLRDRDEGGAFIDPSSALEFTRDADGALADAAELGRRLAGSNQVKSCFVTQSFRYAYGRAETTMDACTQQRLEQGFLANGQRLREMLVQLALTDTFLYRTAPSP